MPVDAKKLSVTALDAFRPTPTRICHTAEIVYNMSHKHESTFTD
jgi:hypothetical protein